MAGHIGRIPVASLRKRLVYKTEFDLFKQNSELDLISLISYEEESLEPKTNYREGKEHVSKPVESSKSKTSTCSWNYKEKETRISSSNIKRSTLIDRQNTENYRTQGTKRNERACKSAVNYKGNYSRGCDVTQRSRTAFGSRTAVYDKTERNNSCGFGVNGRGISSSKCSKYRSCASARQSTTDQNTKGYVRSTSAFGRSTCHSLSRQTTVSRDKSRTENVHPSRINRPVTVAGTRDILNKGQSLNTASVLQTRKSSLRKVHSDSPTGEISSNHASVIVKTETSKDYQKLDSKAEVISAFTQDTDSFDSVKNGDFLESKDSGYHSSECSPDLTKPYAKPTQEVLETPISDISKPEPDAPSLEIKKHVTFNVVNDCGSDVSDVPEVDDLSVTADDAVSDLEDDTESSVSKSNQPIYDLTSLLVDLEETNTQETPTNEKLDSDSDGASENNSICDDSEHVTDDIEYDKEHVSEEAVDNGEDKSTSEDCELANDTAIMSREARYAIIETLQDMRGKRSASKVCSYGNKENASASRLHKAVGQQKRLRDNRSKYDQYMRERTNTTISKTNQNNNTKTKLNGSVYSSDFDSRDCDESESSEEPVKQNLLPAIGNGTSQSRDMTRTKSKVLNLDQVKRKKYKIPGIGNYDLVMSPEAEFEITPPGFDSRYNPRPIISKDEMEPPPQLIRERSILKCKKWLKNVNLSPLSLNPVLKRNESSS